MEVVVSAIIGDLAGRSISFLVDTYLNLKAPVDGDEERLQRLLRRAHVIGEEAARRRITSHAMLRQLDVLRAEMYRGYHALDRHMSSCRGRARSKVDGGGDDSAAVSHHRFAVSRFSPAKRARLMTGGSAGDGRRPRRNEKRQLQQVVGRLEAIIADVKDEFAVFLTACPPLLSRQPYMMHIVIGKCMFGRQMETERVVAFLLHQEDEGDEGNHTQKLGILPIVGPRRSGKSTLVEHACNDERVRDHFSQIVSFTLGDLKDEEDIVTLRSGRVIKRRTSDEGRVLAIVELDGNRNSRGVDNNANIMEDLFRKLQSIYRSRRIPCASKIIVTSRSDKIASLGTAEPLWLDYVAEEACWYFFKVLAFGSTDTAEHPELVSIAMDMAVEMDRCFGLMEVFAQLLRSNFDARFWSSTLAVLREYKKKNLLIDTHDAPKTAVVTSKGTQEFVYHDDYELVGSVDGEVPMISLHDLLFQGTRPRGKFDVLGWKSRIPPYYSYAYCCEILRPVQSSVEVYILDT